jgi:hypothetical protein
MTSNVNDARDVGDVRGPTAAPLRNIGAPARKRR